MYEILDGQKTSESGNTGRYVYTLKLVFFLSVFAKTKWSQHLIFTIQHLLCINLDTGVRGKISALRFCINRLAYIWICNLNLHTTVMVQKPTSQYCKYKRGLGVPRCLLKTKANLLWKNKASTQSLKEFLQINFQGIWIHSQKSKAQSQSIMSKR